MSIIYLKNEKIDKKKWDDALKKTFNASLYAYSWFLDIACYTWDALLTPDYSILMPLPIKKYANNLLVYKPFFIQELGIFSEAKINADIETLFWNAIPKKIKYVKLSINCFNNFDFIIKGGDVEISSVYKFDLIEEYGKIYKELYSQKFKDEIDIALQQGYSAEENNDIELLFDFIATNNNYMKHFGENDFARYQVLIKTLVKYNLGKIITCNFKGKLCAVAFFMLYQNTAILIMYEQSKNVLNNNIINLLLDRYIQDNSVRNITLEIVPQNTIPIIEMLNKLDISIKYRKTIIQNRFSFPFKYFINTQIL